jgi:FKBP-type peptidyl-prolyl cis-trans isomerase FklB
MKSLWISVFCLVLLACQGNTQEKVQITSPKDSVSYSIGMNIGKNLKAQEIDVNPAALAAGIKEAVAGGKTSLTEQQCQEVMMRFQTQMMAKQQEKSKSAGDKNKKDGEAFLAANKAKDGVKTTASGLQYKVIKEGTGPKPTAGQSVTVNYRGTLIDGTEFDSSVKEGGPMTIGLNQVIRGWTEGLQLMSTGSKYEFYIPAELAYGMNPPGPTIPPNAALVFEIELISIK